MRINQCGGATGAELRVRVDVRNRVYVWCRLSGSGGSGAASLRASCAHPDLSRRNMAVCDSTELRSLSELRRCIPMGCVQCVDSSRPHIFRARVAVGVLDRLWTRCCGLLIVRPHDHESRALDPGAGSRRVCSARRGLTCRVRVQGPRAPSTPGVGTAARREA